MAGALLLGYFFALFAITRAESPHPFLGTGVCGTLTTFSTLQLELYEMVDGGYLGWRLAYAAVTIAVGYLFVRLGRSRRGAAAVSAPGWVAVGLLGGVAAAARFLIDAEISARADSRSRSGSSSSTSPAPSRSASSPAPRCTARRW